MGQTTYVWNPAGTGVWTLPANWTPTRTTPATNDILVFNVAGTYVVNDIPNQTIGKLQVSGATNVTLRRAIGSNATLSIRTVAADAFSVATGSTLNILGRDAATDRSLTVALANIAGVTANIGGTVAVGLDAGAGAAGFGAFIKGAAATINFNNGSVYRHNVSAGTIPVATWNFNSTLEFSRGAATTPVNIGANTIFGRLVVTNNTTVTLNGAAGSQSVDLDNGTGDDLVVASGSALTINATIENFTIRANSTAGISGTFTRPGSYIISAANTLTTVSGTFISRAAIAGVSAANFIVTATGTYNHGYNGGAIPAVNWVTGSTCLVSGVTNVMPTGFVNLSNLTWNCTGQSADLAFNADISIGANFTVSGTNNNELVLTNNATARTLAIGGNMTIQNNGRFDATNNAGNAIVNVTGSFNQSSGIYRGNDGITGGSSDLNVGGNLNLSGGTFIGVSGSGGSTVDINGNLNISAGTLTLKEDAGNAALNVTGNFVKTGGTLNQRTVSALGLSIITVSGDFSHSLGTYNMSSVSAASGTLNVAGNFSHTGGTITETGATTANGAIFFNGTTPQIYTSGGTVSNTINYTVNSLATLQMAADATVLNGAAFTLSSGASLGIRSAAGIAVSGVSGNIRTTARTFNTAANYLYNGTAAQLTGNALPNNLTGNFVINNSAGVSLSAPRTINGGNIDLISGTLTATAPNLITFDGTSSNIIRSGGQLVTTAFNYAAPGSRYNITYNGLSKTTGNEFLGGQTIPVRVNNVTVNLTPGESLTMAAGLPVFGISGSAMNGVLTLTNGLVNTGVTNGLILTDAGTVSGASATRYVNGPLAKTGNTAFTFPVGNGGLYMPVALSGTTTFGSALTSTTNSAFIVQPFRANPKLDPQAGTAVTAPLLTVSSCNWWDIDRIAGDRDVFVWLSIDQINDCGATGVLNSDLRVAHWEGTPTSSWVDKGQSAITNVGGTNFLGAATGVVTFSPFTIGDVSGALPVELTKFAAAKKGSEVSLNWTTASEQNNAYFIVERSADGFSFSAIGKVNGAINSSSTLNYNYNDNSPLAGKNFYRLRQVDLDGQFALSSIVSVNMSVNSSSVSLYPNPVLNQALVQYPKAVKGATYRIVSMDGRVMQTGILQENSTQMNITMGGLKSGVYVLIINNNGEQYQQRIQKQ